MQKFLLRLNLVLISIIINISLIAVTPAEIILGSSKTIYIVRYDYLKNHKLYSPFKSVRSYNLNQLYAEKLKQLSPIAKKDPKNLLSNAKIIVIQEINQQLLNILQEQDDFINYKPSEYSQINDQIFDKEFEKAFESEVVDNLKEYINKVIYSNIFKDFNLIQVSGIPLFKKWQFNENTFLIFNDYLNLIEIFGVYLLVEDQPKFFLPNKEAESIKDNLTHPDFIAKKEEFITKIQSKFNNLKQDITTAKINQDTLKPFEKYLNTAEGDLENANYIYALSHGTTYTPKIIKPTFFDLKGAKAQLQSLSTQLHGLALKK